MLRARNFSFQPTETFVADPSSPPRAGSSTWGAFALCCAVWGSTFLVIRIGNEAVAPLWAATLRLALASILLLGLVALRRETLPRGEALRAAVGFGFFNFGLSFCLLYLGEQAVPSGLTAVIYATIPLTTSLLARAFGLEALSPRKILGALIALGGAVTIFAGQLSGAIPLLSLGMIAAAATSASLSGVLLKRGPKQSPFGTNAVAALVGLPVCALASLIARESHALPATIQGWAPILYLTLFGSLVAFVAYAWLVQRWPVTRTAFIAVVVPIVAVLLGAMFRGERLAPAEWAGSLFVLAGVGVAISADARKPAH
jgi:drug/metabolite transporter (DMT)-like permease